MAATAAIAAGIRRAHEQGGLISPTGTPREHRPKKAKEPKHGPPILPNQTDVYEFYHSHKIQVGVAVLIVMNFIFMCAEKEFDPYPTDIQKHKDVWKWGAFIFNIVFLFELIINFYGGIYWRSWFKSGWNVFDLLIVTLGTISIFETLGNTDILPKSLSLLRPFRAFRVFRLFKRVPSLNKIMVALGKAIPGVSNAFLIMVIIMCIYAILAVEFFSQFGKEGVYTTQQDHANRDVDAEWATVCDERGEHCYTYENATVTSITARGFTWGEEYYGTFMRALYTLFQVMTGESWSEAVARPTLLGDSAVLTGIFYVSFILITQIVMVNVVVAVLLEKMVEDPRDELDDEEDDADAPAAEAIVPLESSDADKLGGLPRPASYSGSPALGTSTPKPRSPIGDDTSDAEGELRQFLGAGDDDRLTLAKRMVTLDAQRRRQLDDMQAQMDLMAAQLGAICTQFSVAVPADALAAIDAKQQARRGGGLVGAGVGIARPRGTPSPSTTLEV